MEQNGEKSTEKNRRDRLEQRIGLQRAGLAFEALWHKAHWPLMVLGLAAIVVFSGVLNSLAGNHRLAVLAGLAILFVGSLVPLVRLALPSRYQAMRRMESEAQVAHRGVSSADENMAQEFSSEEQRVIWEEHKRRQLMQLEEVPVATPRSGWRDFDPMALRVPVALGLVAAALLGTGEFSKNLVGAIDPPPPVALNPVTVDAWVRPPAYTGKPPVLLTSPAMVAKRAANPATEVPAGSVVSLRVNNAELVEFKSSAVVPLKQAKTETGSTAEVTLDKQTKLDVVADGKIVESFNFATLADAPPTIVIPKAPEVAARGGLTVHWEVKDDYGVKNVTSEISLTDEQEGGVGFEGNGVFLWDAPKFEVRLKRPNTRDEKGKTTQDLTAHPWAGLRVEMLVTATDAAGQATVAKPVLLTLPERPFLRPLSKALIEQRKALIIVPDKAPEVAGLFKLILAYPKGLTERSAYLVRLSAIASRLENSGDYDAVKDAITDLWQLAVDIDEGSLADARAELKALKEELERAIREGAPPEKIAELSRRMREAMNRLMDQMQAEREQRRKEGGQREQQQSGNSKPITPEDLQKMMDAIEELSKQGAQEQAQALLDELDRILQNLEMGDQQQAGGDRGQMQGMMDQLGEMMKRQQQLMDETQRMPNGGEGEGEEGEQGEGQQPGEGQGEGQGQGQGQMGEGEGQSPNGTRPGKGKGRSRQGMAQEQGELGELLDRMMKELGRDAPGKFGDARKGMGGSEQDLRGGNREGALKNQGDAMKALREGAGELGRKMREQARRGQGQNGRDGNRDGEGAGRETDDPLGRPRATRNPDTEGPDKDIVPSELAMRRAREILEMLRNRANEGTLSDTERSYIDRLLRGLY
jgi:uncharacterized protein (TIGR02302 family)